jgi:hypothetical protein
VAAVWQLVPWMAQIWQPWLVQSSPEQHCVLFAHAPPTWPQLLPELEELELEAWFVLEWPLELPVLPPGPLPVNAQRPSEHSKPEQQSRLSAQLSPELRHTLPPLLLELPLVVLGGQAARQSARQAARETRWDMNPPKRLRVLAGYYDCCPGVNAARVWVATAPGQIQRPCRSCSSCQRA